MQRRTFLQSSLFAAFGARHGRESSLCSAEPQQRWRKAIAVLESATATGQVTSAVLHVVHSDSTFTRAFGKASSENAMFLLGSISKPIAIAALMTLYDQGEFRLSDPLKKFIPKYVGDGREAVTMQHLLTHVSGLPDQLSNNDALRKKHAPLSEFVEQAIRTPLEFVPGSRYQYSSMAILLASHVAELISKTDILTLVEQAVLRPLNMKHSAQGLGKFALADFVPVQTEFAAVESGGGDPTAKDWDWNSTYWRRLGAPWGGSHASAADVGKFLGEFLWEKGAIIKPETAKMMVANHNLSGQTPRGLGFNVGAGVASKGCSEKTFGHTGSTGTIAWADPVTRTICVVLTSLPARAVKPHPRDLAAAEVAGAIL